MPDITIHQTCITCAQSKTLDSFNKSKRRKNGYSNQCIKCWGEYKRARYAKDPDKIRGQNQATYFKDWERSKEQGRAKYHKNKHKYQDRLKALRATPEFKAKRAEKAFAYRRRRADIIEKHRKSYYRRKHELHVLRLDNDPLYSLIINLRSKTVRFIRSKGVRRSDAPTLLGADHETARRHIERQFQPGMSWLNYGEWNIDHIVPLSSAKTPSDVHRLLQIDNLQPLWATDNCAKGIKSNEEFLREKARRAHVN